MSKIETNITEYEGQLRTVENALLACTDAEEQAELEGLKLNLLELLELTKEAVAGIDKRTKEENVLSDEMQRFQNEIEQLESAPTDGATAMKKDDDDDDVELHLQELKTKLEEMVGQKCSAPHKHSWGAVTYHNAIVCGLEDTVEIGTDGTLELRVRVLFTNPTHREMMPCTYYLDGECRFNEARCHYSHGELVPPEKLREYKVPNFENLGRNCVVLAKMDDRLWHRGRVLYANFVEKMCRVQLEGKQHKQREKDFTFEDVFPIFNDEDHSSGSSSDSNDSSDSDDLDDYEANRRAQLVEQSLFTFQPTQALGAWEKHTRGIGSKLMAKMGYVHGTGLGSDGRGIITPIPAQVLPPGRSLDYCMELREAANGDKDLFNVEKKLLREQKKQAAVNAKAYERAAQRGDVFSFLNGSILSSQRDKKEANASVREEKPPLRNQTTKSLNVESVRIADDMRRKEREISKLQESLQRNANGTEVYKRLQAQLSFKTQELQALQDQEKCLTREQATRRTKDKLCVF